MLNKNEITWIKNAVQPIYAKYSRGNDEYNINEKTIESKIEIFNNSLEVATLIEDTDRYDFEYIRCMPQKIEESISALTAGRLVESGDFLFLEPYLKFLAYLKNEQNFYDSMLMSAYKKLEILGNPYTPQNVDKYAKLSVSKEDKKSPFVKFDDPTHPENTLNDKPRIMPFVMAYVARNTIAHGKVIKPNIADSQNGATIKIATNEHFGCVLFTCIEQANKLKTTILERYKYEKNEYELIENYIKKYLRKYEEDHERKDYYIPLGIEFSQDYKNLASIKRNKMTTAYIDEVIDKDLEKNESYKIRFNRELNFNIVKFVGYAGIGKTTFLEYITYRDLSQIEKTKTTLKMRIPVLIRLIDINEKNYDINIEDLIAQTLEIDVNIVKILLKNKKLNIYLDGLNELQLNETEKKKFYNKILNFINKYKDLKILITDRDSNKQSILFDYPTMMMVGVTKEIRDEFIRRNSTDAEYVIHALNEDSNKFEKSLLNPYFLKAMISVIQNKGRVPKNMREFQKDFLNAIINREIIDKKNDNAEYLKDMLTDLVKHTYSADDILTEININIPKEKVIKIFKEYKDRCQDEEIQPDVILDLAIKLGILENNNNIITFKEAGFYSGILDLAKEIKYI